MEWEMRQVESLWNTPEVKVIGNWAWWDENQDGIWFVAPKVWPTRIAAADHIETCLIRVSFHGHGLKSVDPLCIVGSIPCWECAFHGFIWNGRLYDGKPPPDYKGIPGDYMRKE